MIRTDESGQGAVAVTPSDTVDIAYPSGTRYGRWIYVGGAGDLKVKLADGSDATFTAVSVGVFHPIAVTRVYSTGTTATGIIAII